jgi:hypothetical protein
VEYEVLILENEQQNLRSPYDSSCIHFVREPARLSRLVRLPVSLDDKREKIRKRIPSNSGSEKILNVVEFGKVIR